MVVVGGGEGLQAPPPGVLGRAPVGLAVVVGREQANLLVVVCQADAGFGQRAARGGAHHHEPMVVVGQRLMQEGHVADMEQHCALARHVGIGCGLH